MFVRNKRPDNNLVECWTNYILIKFLVKICLSYRSDSISVALSHLNREKGQTLHLGFIKRDSYICWFINKSQHKEAVSETNHIQHWRVVVKKDPHWITYSVVGENNSIELKKDPPWITYSVVVENKYCSGEKDTGSLIK